MTRKVSHRLFAHVWVWLSAELEKHGAAEQRQRLLSGLEGRVIEIGAGNGMNFAHYPTSIDKVIAVEPDPHLRELAAHNAARAPVEIEVVDGVAERLPAPDDAFDAAVASLVLCSVEDQQVALDEIRRVLHPRGRLRFFEHVVADGAAHRQLQQVLDATIWPRIGGGCHMARDTVASIAEAGFAVTAIDRFRFPDTRLPVPTSPSVLGEAELAATTTERESEGLS